jgi:hypothetical protein
MEFLTAPFFPPQTAAQQPLASTSFLPQLLSRFRQKKLTHRILAAQNNLLQPPLVNSSSREFVSLERTETTASKTWISLDMFFP